MNVFFVRRMLGLIAMGGVLAFTPELLCAAGAAPLDVAVNFQPNGTKGENAAWPAMCLLVLTSLTTSIACTSGGLARSRQPSRKN